MPDLLSRRSRSGLLAGIALGVLTLFPIAHGSLTPAQAQVSVSADFRVALEPYGAWRKHPRWGEVWVPAGRARDWRPYQVGHWVYTEEWGWYWISDEDEADWGWVAYHYCRWIFDRGYGWACVPGNEWAPAWVDWRHGDDYVGWAPLPPDDVIVETRDDPQFWVFVRQRDLIAPRLRTVFLPLQQRTVYIQRTVVVNRTVVIDRRDHRFAVNPGIPPAYIAAATRRPLPTYQVRPRVFVGTRGIEGGVEIRADEFRGRRGTDPRGTDPRSRDRVRAPEVAAQRTSTVIQPAASVPPPQALGREEKGRLGTTPPKAAQAAPPSATPPPAQATPGGEPPRPAAPPAQAAPPSVTPPPAQTTPRAEPPRPAAPPPQAAPPSVTPPPPAQATPRAEPPRPAAPPPQAAPPSVTPPPPAQATPRVDPPRPASPPPPQTAPRAEPPRPVAPPPPQTAPRAEPPRPAAPPPQAAPQQPVPPRPAAPAQQQKKDKKDKKGSE